MKIIIEGGPGISRIDENRVTVKLDGTEQVTLTFFTTVLDDVDVAVQTIKHLREIQNALDKQLGRVRLRKKVYTKLSAR